MELIVRHDKNEITADWLKKGLGNDYTYVYKKIPDPSSPEFLNLSEKTKYNCMKLLLTSTFFAAIIFLIMHHTLSECLVE